MSWLSSFLHPGKGYEKGQEQLDKYYNQAQGNLQPYNQNGQEQYGNLSDIIKNLMDPTELNKKWTESYTESPQAKQAEAMAQEHGLNAASSMGLMGSNTALNATQAGTTQIGLDDRQNYLDSLMQKYLAGAGLSQGIYGQGANAAGQQSQNAMNMGQNSAEMAYGKQNAGGNMLSGLIGQGVGLAGSALGGPIGGALAKRWNLSGGA
jgi:hypothetical protein